MTPTLTLTLTLILTLTLALALTRTRTLTLTLSRYALAVLELGLNARVVHRLLDHLRRGRPCGRGDGGRIEGDAPGRPQLHHLRPCSVPGQATRNHWRAAVSTTLSVWKIFHLWVVYPPSKLRHHAAHPRASALLLGDDDASDVLGARHGPPLACIRAPLPRKGFSTSLVVSAPSTKG